jgi:hypothetical protein
MSKHSLFAALAACALAAPFAQAQVAVSADLGTTGAGVHLVVPMETYLNGRFGFNTYSRDTDKSSSGIDYKVKAKLRTFDMLFDYFPMTGSALRVTGGIVYNGNKFDADAVPGADGKYTINGHTYAASTVGTLKGDISFRRAAPYLGIGWGNPLAANAAGWSFGGDLGAFFQGRPNPHLVSYGCTDSAVVCTILAKDVAAEQQKFGDDVSNFKVYPVLRASVSYRF